MVPQRFRLAVPQRFAVKPKLYLDCIDLINCLQEIQHHCIKHEEDFSHFLCADVYVLLRII